MTAAIDTTGAEYSPGKHFVYQRLHVRGGRAMHLDAHLRIAARAFGHIYGYDPTPDRDVVEAGIADIVRLHRPSVGNSSTVLLYLSPDDDGGHRMALYYERPLLEAGYAHSPLRPRAVSFEYSIPFGGFPTNFQIEARALFDTLALSGHGATRSVRRLGEGLISCGDATLFAIRGGTIFTPPLTEGATDGVERSLVMEAAASSRLGVREEPILHSELKSFDELLFADAAGITSLSECDGAKFMSLAAPRLAAAIKANRG